MGENEALRIAKNLKIKEVWNVVNLWENDREWEDLRDFYKLLSDGKTEQEACAEIIINRHNKKNSIYGK
tara:strand:+ start:84 stop:290 length:207 start_codon:yes stop_codon:yes gene_type:complete